MAALSQSITVSERERIELEVQAHQAEAMRLQNKRDELALRREELELKKLERELGIE